MIESEEADLFKQLKDQTAKVCNCAECRCELVSVRYAAQVGIARSLYGVKRQDIKVVAGHIKGRPYCFDCLNYGSLIP